MVPTVEGGLTVGGVRTSRWCLPTIAHCLGFGGISELTSKATSRFDRLATRFGAGEGWVNTLRRLFGRVPVSAPQSSFIIQILELGS